MGSTDNRFILIAGPCAVESQSVCMQVGTEVRRVCDDLGLRLIFKSSYKKANRSKLSSFTGIGDEKALKILDRVRSELNVETITDVHESSEIERAATYVDHLQIPAFLCRQTELLLAAGRSGRLVNIKKGQFLSPEAMQFPIEKVRSTGNNNIWVTERGTTFGYSELIVDATAIHRLKKLGQPVIMDCTHATQKTNRQSGISGGDPEMIETLALSAVATGADGLFIETHPEPSKALSDAGSMLPLERLRPVLENVLRMRQKL